MSFRVEALIETAGSLELNEMSEPDEKTIERMHRWFAVECNNRGWDLGAQDSRSDGENREILQCAYAAALHWGKVGKPINDARADTLLSRAHSNLNHGDLAIHYANLCLEFFEQNDCEDWDLAFVHGEMAYAAAVSGNYGLSQKHYELARNHGDQIKDDTDREIFVKDFERITKWLEKHHT